MPLNLSLVAAFAVAATRVVWGTGSGEVATQADVAADKVALPGQRLLAGAAFVIGLLGGFLVLASFGFVGVWERGIFGNDFSLIWTGPHLFVMGANPYDPQVWQRQISELGVQATSTSVFIYPGWVPIAIAPFGALPLPIAAPLWLAITLVIAATGLFALGEARFRQLPLAHTLFAFALIGSEPGIVTFYSGQWDFLLVGGLALMALWLRRRPALAGVAASVMLFKPQLFFVAVPALFRVALVRKARGFVLAFVAFAVLAAVASAIAFPGWWQAWAAVPTSQAGDIRAATLPNGLRDTFGTPGLVVGVALVLTLIAAGLRFSPRSEAAVPVWIAISLSAAPYAFVYDHVLALVPLALATGIIGQRDRARALGLAAVGVAILVVGAVLLHAFPGVDHGTLSFNGIAQFALLAMVVWALWPYRRVSVG